MSSNQDEQQRIVNANEAVGAIRDERNRRRAGEVERMFHPAADDCYVWDNMANGPYAAYNKTTEMVAVDAIGLMYELGYHPVYPGGETKFLEEVHKELANMASHFVMYIDAPHLQMLVALVHRIIDALYQRGELTRVCHEKRNN